MTTDEILDLGMNVAARVLEMLAHHKREQEEDREAQVLEDAAAVIRALARGPTYGEANTDARDFD